MTQAIAYLSFNGNCAEAMRFYEKATVAEAEQVFAALSEGGQVTMPVQPAFWAKS